MVARTQQEKGYVSTVNMFVEIWRDCATTITTTNDRYAIIAQVYAQTHTHTHEKSFCVCID